MDNTAAPIPSISPQPAVQPEAFPPAESSNRRWFLWLIGGLAVLVFGIAIGIFSAKFLNQSQRQSQLTSTPTPTLSPTPAPTPDPTADWEIYTNETLSFSFSYPQELSFIYDQLKDYTDDKAPSGNLLLQNFDGSKPRQELPADFQIAIFVSKDNQTSLEQLAQNAQSQSTSSLTIAGEKALRGTSIQKYKPVPTVWLKHSGHLFTVQFSIPESTNTSWFDQILFTFHFLK